MRGSETEMRKAVEDRQAKRYLLGKLSEEKRAQVESDYFENDEAFERLGAIEDDLIDAYAQGQLSASDRKRFEQRLLLSEAQSERVRFAQTLRLKLSQTQINSSIPPRPRNMDWWTSLSFLRGLNPAIPVSAVLIIALVIG